MDLEWMYNIILDSESAFWVEIEGIKCVSSGHNVTQDKSSPKTKILPHEYFGSSKVIDDLEKFKSELEPESKIIVLENYIIQRSVKTGLICGIKKNN